MSGSTSGSEGLDLLASRLLNPEGSLGTVRHFRRQQTPWSPPVLIRQSTRLRLTVRPACTRARICSRNFRSYGVLVLAIDRPLVSL